MSVILINFVSFVAQPQRTSVLMSALRGHYGFIIPHSSTIKDITWSKPRGFEIEAAWLLMSESSWRYCYCYPRAGFSFFFIDFGNPKVLGNAYSLYAFIEPLLGAGRKIYGSIRFGIGPVYLDNVYDSVTNPANRFYSSPVSFVVLLNAGINYKIGEKVNLRLSGHFNHISNGGIKNPNTGINYPTLSLGVDYWFNPMPFQHRVKDKSVELISYKGRWDAALIATAKTDIKGEESYPVTGLLANYCHVIGRINGISLGLEFIADFADRHEIYRLSQTKGTEIVDYKYLAALLGHDLLLGRFNFQIQMGAYIYSPFKRMDPVFQRYSLSFYMNKHIYAGVSVKAHRHVADFLDVRIGYSFPAKR